MVSITYKTTAGAMMDSIREFFSLSISAPRAILGSICGVDFCNLSTSIFSFIGQVLSKLRPCKIRDTFRKTAVMNHLIDRQIFNTDYTILINNLSKSISDVAWSQ